jgi:hypothetical protein
MSNRGERRTKLFMPVDIWGMDDDGRVFEEHVFTVDITPVGARLRGVTRPLRRGSIIGIRCGRSKARFRVMWVRASEGAQGMEIGTRLIDVGKYIWGKPLERVMGDSLSNPAAARLTSNG